MFVLGQFIRFTQSQSEDLHLWSDEVAF